MRVLCPMRILEVKDSNTYLHPLESFQLSGSQVRGPSAVETQTLVHQTGVSGGRSSHTKLKGRKRRVGVGTKS